MKGAHIHRFGDKIAISLPGAGATVYLTPAQAKAIAKALNAGARNVKEQPRFSTSTFSTVHIPISEQ